MSATWTREAIDALGPTTDVPTAASIVGVHEWTVYEQIRRGEWDLTRVLRIGRKIRIPTHDLITVLYGAGPSTDPAAADVVREDITTHDDSPLRAVRARSY